MAKKKPISEIIEDIENSGFKIIAGLDEYKNTRSRLVLVCEKGHIWENVNYNIFIKRRGCPTCNGHKRYTYEEVYDYFKDNGCQLLSEEYKDNRTHLHYICNCGNQSKIYFKDFKKGVRCRKCSGSEKHTYEYVKLVFEEQDCTLLSKEYKDGKTKLDYICSCGRQSSITYSNFVRGVRCEGCYREKTKGENSRFWNHDKTEAERLDDRKYNQYKQWRRDVFERDGYTCQHCGDNKGGNLNAHHLDSYHWCKERRLDISNGVTLCDICHSDFHDANGYKNNTEQQFKDWIVAQMKIAI